MLRTSFDQRDPRGASTRWRVALAGVAIAAATALVLTACVGIPTSGSVQSGPVINNQVNPDFVVLPSGPRAGATQEEILADFMQAVRAPQSDYQIARTFLASGLSDTWKPDASALIRTTAATTARGTEPQTLDYTVTSKAYVDASGRYIEQPPATQTLSFGFTQEKGEWRISSAPDGIVLSQASFNVGFTEQALYFFDPSYGYLVPDVRWFPSRASVSLSIVRALLAGPTAWLQQAVTSSFPLATSLGSNTDPVKVASGTATVDLSKEALTASDQDRERMRQQLVATLGPVLGVSTINVTVGGIALTIPDSTSAGAVVDPRVDGGVLAGTATSFGFATESGVTSLGGLSDKVVALGATAATLTNDKQYATVLGADRDVYVVDGGARGPQTVDGRGGLIAPTIDPFRFVWSAQAASAASLTTFEVDGTEHPVQSGLPADASIVSMAMSRDGTRLLLYLSTNSGPELVVAGVIRGSGNVPARLGTPVVLSSTDEAPLGATWINDRTVAAISRSGAGATVQVTQYEIGGPSVAVGLVPDASAIVGGNGGIDGARLLRASGQVWRPQGSGGWVDTGIVASFLGTNQ